MGYPFKQLFRLIALTGVRRTEACGARWGEFLDLDDPAKSRWEIPAARFKSNATHLVPLSADALAVLATVPRFQRGDALFSFSYGVTPVTVLHQGKAKLDALMTRYLRALARLRGDAGWQQLTLMPFVTHDLRRVVRTKLAALEVNDGVAEMCLGHGRKGLARVYNQHSGLPQMRRALEAWASELRRIVSPPPPGKVLPLRGRRR